MSFESILNIVMRGESEELELKTTLLDPSLLSRLISSFANNKGGKIIIGVKESGEVVGVTKPVIERIFKAAINRISPIPKTKLDFVSTDNKDLAVI